MKVKKEKEKPKKKIHKLGKIDKKSEDKDILLSHHENDNLDPNPETGKTEGYTNTNNNFLTTARAKRFYDTTKFDMEPIQNDFLKEYNNMRLSKDEDFMQRMLFDVFRRQTKTERLNNMLTKNKPKLNEEDRVQAFNRLIEDANRRIEATERIENMKTTTTSANDEKIKKSRTQDEWLKIYNDRFMSYKENRDIIIQKKIIEKEKVKKEQEDQVIDELNKKTKKAPKHYVEGVIRRMHDEADRRKIIMETKKNEIERVLEKDKKKDPKDKEKASGRDLTPPNKNPKSYVFSQTVILFF